MSVHSSNQWEGHGPLFWTLAIGLSPVAFLLCWGLHEVVIRYVHYSVGALISFFQLAVAVRWISGPFETPFFMLESKAESGESKVLAAKLKVTQFVTDISGSVTAALILMTAFAWVSYALVRLGLGVTKPASAVTYASLIKTYGWHFVDLIPLMHVEKSLGLPGPAVEFQGWTMGAPILAFRVLVGIVALTAIRRAWLRFLSD